MRSLRESDTVEQRGSPRICYDKDNTQAVMSGNDFSHTDEHVSVKSLYPGTISGWTIGKFGKKKKSRYGVTNGSCADDGPWSVYFD